MKLTPLWLMPLVFLLSFSAYAQEAESDPYAGQYELIKPPQPTGDPDKVEIVELFWYVCPHCYSFERRYLHEWLKTLPAYVNFIQMPAVFPNDRWMPLAKAYYTAEVLGVLDKMHIPIFRAIHDYKKNLNSEEALKKFFVEQGVDAETFTKTYNSFAVDMKMREARILTQKFQITGVPVIVVNGQYRLTSEKANGYENMLKIIEHLIKQEHKPKIASNP